MSTFQERKGQVTATWERMLYGDTKESLLLKYSEAFGVAVLGKMAGRSDNDLRLTILT